MDNMWVVQLIENHWESLLQRIQQERSFTPQ